VPPLPALETHFKPALTPDSVTPSLTHKSVTVRACAPLEIRISVDIYVFFELQIFLKDLLRAEFPNVFTCVLGWTGDICTLDFRDLAVGDVEGDVVGHAVQAEAMLAGINAMEILRVVGFVTDVTGFTSFFKWLDFSLCRFILSFKQLDR
jgi:hypothetical protein